MLRFIGRSNGQVERPPRSARSSVVRAQSLSRPRRATTGASRTPTNKVATSHAQLGAEFQGIPSPGIDSSVALFKKSWKLVKKIIEPLVLH